MISAALRAGTPNGPAAGPDRNVTMPILTGCCADAGTIAHVAATASMAENVASRIVRKTSSCVGRALVRGPCRHTGLVFADQHSRKPRAVANENRAGADACAAPTTREVTRSTRLSRISTADEDLLPRDDAKPIALSSATASAFRGCHSFSCCTTACDDLCSYRRSRPRSRTHRIFGFACGQRPQQLLDSKRTGVQRNIGCIRTGPAVSWQGSAMARTRGRGPHVPPE